MWDSAQGYYWRKNKRENLAWKRKAISIKITNHKINLKDFKHNLNNLGIGPKDWREQPSWNWSCDIIVYVLRKRFWQVENTPYLKTDPAKQPIPSKK